MKKITGKYFDKRYWTEGIKSGYTASSYSSNNYMNEAKAQMLIELYGSKGYWLEAGCAFGWVVEQLLIYDWDLLVDGFDISKYSIKNCPEEIKDNIWHSNGLDIKSFPTDHYDIIYSFETAEHIAEKNAKQWLDNLYCWLKPGGRLFMTICLGHNNIRGLDDNDESHQTLQPREWWEARIEGRGFIKDREVFDKAQTIITETERMKKLGVKENLVKQYNWHVFAWRKQNEIRIS